MSSLSLFEDKIRSANSILVAAHINPDGDALGSTIAMKNVIKEKYGKNVDAVFVGKFPEIYSFMPFADELIPATDIDENKIYDVAIALDVASKERLSLLEKVYDNAKYKVNIDHHKTNNNYGDFALVDGDASSTGEVLYELFEKISADITEITAMSLYVSILTDTGCFKFKNTTENSMVICSKLLKNGVDPAYLALKIYDEKPKAMVMLSAWAVANTKFVNADKIAYSVITQDDLKRFNADTDYTEGIVEILRQIKTVDVAILFKELPNGFTKVSFRSKKTDVAEVCKKFDGGGHTNAAGCTVKKPVSIAIEKILNEVLQ